MKANCDAIIAIADQLREIFSVAEFYVPAEHEFPPVGYFLRKGYLTPEQALEIDCEIISECDAMIVYVPEGDVLQGGRKIEWDYAFEHGIPVFIFVTIEQAISWITHQILRA